MLPPHGPLLCKLALLLMLLYSNRNLIICVTDPTNHGVTLSAKLTSIGTIECEPCFHHYFVRLPGAALKQYIMPPVLAFRTCTVVGYLTLLFFYSCTRYVVEEHIPG